MSENAEQDNPPPEPTPPQRVVAYVDGFNLYHGLVDDDKRKRLWLNVHEMCRRMLLPHQKLGVCKYFTSRIAGGSSKDGPRYAAEKNARRKRQSTYLDALGTIEDLEIITGKFYENSVQCNSCKHEWASYEEKMTDVNIATQMLMDAFAGNFDTALLVSADSDLVPPVNAIRKLFPEKRVVVAFPPSRNSVELRLAANCQFIINDTLLKKSQLPEQIVVSGGFQLQRPSTWI